MPFVERVSKQIVMSFFSSPWYLGDCTNNQIDNRALAPQCPAWTPPDTQDQFASSAGHPRRAAARLAVMATGAQLCMRSVTVSYLTGVYVTWFTPDRHY
jgi:hypothetical protein